MSSYSTQNLSFLPFFSDFSVDAHQFSLPTLASLPTSRPNRAPRRRFSILHVAAHYQRQRRRHVLILVSDWPFPLSPAETDLSRRDFIPRSSVKTSHLRKTFQRFSSGLHLSEFLTLLFSPSLSRFIQIFLLLLSLLLIYSIRPSLTHGVISHLFHSAGPLAGLDQGHE